MLEGRQTLDDAWRFVEEHAGGTAAVLVYSSDTPEKVREYQKLGAEKVAAALEGAAAGLAVRAVKAGYTRISIRRWRDLRGSYQRPGLFLLLDGRKRGSWVPIMVPAERPDIRPILKSGNFGQEDFFGRALAMTAKLNTPSHGAGSITKKGGNMEDLLLIENWKKPYGPPTACLNAERPLVLPQI